MKVSSVFLNGLLLVVCGTEASQSKLKANSILNSGQSDTQQAIHVPDTYIVELDPSTGAASPSSRFAKSHGRSIKCQIRKEFSNSKYFYGLSLTVTDGTKKSDILSAEGVKNVWPVRNVGRPQPFTVAVSASPSNDTLPHITGTSDVNRPLAMAAVDKVHDMGIKGKGVKIALIDTGVDYLHPADPLTTCATGGHGSHVSGIIGMVDQANQGFGLEGVAPEASLGMYRDFGCVGSAPDDIIISGMQKAAEDGADIISMSLGDSVSWKGGSPYVTVVQTLVDSGVAVIAALGNSGQSGPFQTSVPGLAPAALGVGSVENEIYPTIYRAKNNIGGSLNYISVLPFLEKAALTVYPVGTGVATPITDLQADGCDPNDWTAAANNLLALNITNVIFYTNDPDTPALLADPGTVDPFNLIFLTYTDSQKLLKDLSRLPNGKNYALSFNSADVFDAPNPAGHTIDYFSSIGPSMEMTLKPQLSAPGGNILSTYPRSAGGYAIMSGTSMAMPFTAGSTAVPMKAQNVNTISSVTQQGGGLINAYEAVMAGSQISPSQLSLRDSVKPANQSITVKNTSKKAKSYTISHTGASYIRTLSNFTSGDAFILQSFTLNHEAKYATVKFSKTKFTLGRGQSTTVQAQITPAQEPVPESGPVYSGFIDVDTDSSSYVVPYLGVPYNRHDANYFHFNTTAWVGNQRPFIGPSDQSPNDVNIGNYIVGYENGTIPPVTIIPFIEFVVVQPTNLLRLDAVPVNTTFVPTYYGFDPSVKINVSDMALPILPGYLDVPYYGQLAVWGAGTLPPSIDPNGLVNAVNRPNIISGYILNYPTFTYENGTLFGAPAGGFRPLLRVLKYGSNGTSSDDYWSWLGPICNILN